MNCKVLAFASLAFLLFSCSPNCKEVTLQKPVWTTHYEDYWITKDTVRRKIVTIDTLVPYSMTHHEIHKKHNNKYNNKTYHYEYTGSTNTHYVTIRNNSNKHSNFFAIQVKGEEYNERQQNWQVFDRMSKYVSIPPKASRTLSITYSDRWQENTSDPGGNIHIYIRQKPIRINTEKITISKIKKKCVRRIDEIIFKDTIVNNCECDIDALKAEHKAIQETYERLKREKLIRE